MRLYQKYLRTFDTAHKIKILELYYPNFTSRFRFNAAKNPSVFK